MSSSPIHPKAIASLALGIASVTVFPILLIFVICALPLDIAAVAGALVLGRQAKKEIQPGDPRGNKLVSLSIVIGWIGAAICAAFALYALAAGLLTLGLLVFQTH